MSYAVVRSVEARDLLGFKSISQDILDRAQGSNVRVLQIEIDLFEDHESLTGQIEAWPEAGIETRERFFEAIRHAVHATAVASIITDPNFGVAPKVDFHFYGTHSLTDFQEGDGLLDILSHVCNNAREMYGFSEGDIVSISFQLPTKIGDKFLLLPIDVDKDIRRSINHLTDDIGAIVLISAGNSGANLDGVDLFEGHDDFNKLYSEIAKKSRAIRVGYSNNGCSDTLLSNFGECVDLFCPAESVRAACYDFNPKTHVGDLIDCVSGGFSRTSASTPMIAGLIACLQSYYRESTGGKSLTRDDVMSLVHKTTRATRINGKSLGRFPNFAELVANL